MRSSLWKVNFRKSKGRFQKCVRWDSPSIWSQAGRRWWRRQWYESTTSMKGAFLSLERELHIDTKASQSGNLIHSNPFNDNDRENTKTKTRMRGELYMGRKAGSSVNLKLNHSKSLKSITFLKCTQHPSHWLIKLPLSQILGDERGHKDASKGGLVPAGTFLLWVTLPGPCSTLSK